MPRNSQKASYYPASDNATYRDLLLFEERLKTNAASLRRRKSRYQAFLLQLVLAIIVLASDLWLDTEFLTIPLNFIIRRTWNKHHKQITAHRFVEWGMLMVAITTLVLFFASGTYAEKIGYANKYVPSANRALRNFNIYLNVRPRPIHAYLNPLQYLFPRPTFDRKQSEPISRPSSPTSPTRLSPIPPAQNPRGELIFSTKVDRGFRDSYDRYRFAFEKKRMERETAAQLAKWARWIPFWKPKVVPVHIRLPRDGSPAPSGRSSPVPSSSRPPGGARLPLKTRLSVEGGESATDSESDTRRLRSGRPRISSPERSLT